MTGGSSTAGFLDAQICSWSCPGLDAQICSWSCPGLDAQICSWSCPGTLSLRCALHSHGPAVCCTPGWEAEPKRGAHSAAGQLDTERSFRMVSNPSWHRPQPRRERGRLAQSPRGACVQLLSCTRCFVTLLIIACQAPLSFTISQSLLKFMSTELMMPSNHLILCHPLLLLPSVFSSVRVFSNEPALRI